MTTPAWPESGLLPVVTIDASTGRVLMQAWVNREALISNGGVNPVTGERVLDGEHVPKVLAVMMMAGMYDGAGRWAFDVGLPAKSGVGGGIVAVVPGRLAIAAFSPRLDEEGNSVRAGLAIRRIAEKLDLGLFGSAD